MAFTFVSALSLLLLHAQAAPPAAPIPWIPPLRSRAMIAIPLSGNSPAAAIARIAAECGRRSMAIATRSAVQLVCKAEPDYASRLAYRTAMPEPAGPLEGFVRFTVLQGDGNARIEALQYSEYNVRGRRQQLLSDNAALVKDMLAAAGLSGL